MMENYHLIAISIPIIVTIGMPPQANRSLHLHRQLPLRTDIFMIITKVRSISFLHSKSKPLKTKVKLDGIFSAFVSKKSWQTRSLPFLTNFPCMKIPKEVKKKSVVVLFYNSFSFWFLLQSPSMSLDTTTDLHENLVLDQPVTRQWPLQRQVRKWDLRVRKPQGL